jgi:osmotically-inducible protein OsmY
MAAEHVGSLTSISVNADPSGVVSLSGSAATQDDIDKVVSIAHNTAGVTAVNNSLTVKSN